MPPTSRPTPRCVPGCSAMCGRRRCCWQGRSWCGPGSSLRSRPSPPGREDADIHDPDRLDFGGAARASWALPLHEAPMSAAIENLLSILDLEPLEVNLFRGLSPQVGWQRVFGGQVLGQALVAAIRTVEDPDRLPHSMHAYFLLAGDPKVRSEERRVGEAATSAAGA